MPGPTNGRFGPASLEPAATALQSGSSAAHSDGPHVHRPSQQPASASVSAAASNASVAHHSSGRLGQRAPANSTHSQVIDPDTADQIVPPIFFYNSSNFCIVYTHLSLNLIFRLPAHSGVIIASRFSDWCSSPTAHSFTSGITPSPNRTICVFLMFACLLQQRREQTSQKALLKSSLNAFVVREHWALELRER